MTDAEQHRAQPAAPVTSLLPPPKALDTTGDVWHSWEAWKQEFELFSTATYLDQQPKESPVQRLMGRQTRTLLPVPTSHLQPQTVPPKTVRRRLEDIRSKQRCFYNRGTRPLPELRTGSTATMYNVPSRSWSPVTVVQRAETPRAYIVKTEEGQHIPLD
ncbi:uncharacterized protein LOC144111977 [Amblyomma americanum]